MREIKFVKELVETLGATQALEKLKEIIKDKPESPDAKYYVHEHTENFGGVFGFYANKCIIGHHDLNTHMRVIALGVIYDAIEVVKGFGGIKKTHDHAFSPECYDIKLKILEKMGIYMKVFSKKYTEDEDYINSLPTGESYDPPERILCAANREAVEDEITLLGLRHGDDFMWDYITDAGLNAKNFKVEGFLTTKGRFVTRQEAWIIAVDQRQIVRRCGSDNADGGTLYSENLY